MSIITQVSIKGFKSIWDQTLDLGQLNVFIGTNGAGKSNFLEAIAMLSASAEGGIDYERLARRGARLSSPEIFRSAFKKKERKTAFELKVNFDNFAYDAHIHSVKNFAYLSESFKKNNKKLSGRSNRGATLFGDSINKLESDKSIINLMQNFEGEYTNIIEDLRKFAIYAPSTPILRGVAEDKSYKEPLGIYGGRLAYALAEMARDNKTRNELQRFFKLFDWFQKIGTSSQIKEELVSEHISMGRNVVTYIDKYMKTNFNELYAYDVSEGALYVLFVLALLLHKESPNIFALDNVDNTLNPGLVTNLMKQIAEILGEKPEKQVFLTTHNPTTLDAIDLFNNKHRLFVVSRSEQGQTEFKRIEPPKGMTKEIWEKTHYGLKLSEIWLSGAIGGLPKGF
jgi:predicted ATPase